MTHSFTSNTLWFFFFYRKMHNKAKWHSTRTLVQLQPHRYTHYTRMENGVIACKWLNEIVSSPAQHSIYCAANGIQTIFGWLAQFTKSQLNSFILSHDARSSRIYRTMDSKHWVRTRPYNTVNEFFSFSLLLANRKKSTTKITSFHLQYIFVYAVIRYESMVYAKCRKHPHSFFYSRCVFLISF